MAKNNNGTHAHKPTDQRGDNAATEPRDDEGRFAKARASLPKVKLPAVKLPKVTLPKVKRPDMKLPELTARNAAIGALGAGAVVAAVAVGAALLRDRKPDETVADDMASDAAPSQGAVKDESKMSIPMTVIDDDKREAFAPALKPVPSRVEAMGNGDD